MSPKRGRTGNENIRVRTIKNDNNSSELVP